MAQDNYQGHASYGASAQRDPNIAEGDRVIAPSESGDYDIADFTDQPGAAARANGWPRATSK